MSIQERRTADCPECSGVTQFRAYGPVASAIGCEHCQYMIPARHVRTIDPPAVEPIMSPDSAW
jgi:hypothetical protein